MDWEIFDDIVKEKYSEDATGRTDMYEACEAAYLMANKEPVAEVPCSMGLCVETLKEENLALRRLLTLAYLSLDRNVGVQDIYVDYDAVDKLKEKIQAAINT